MAGVIHHHDIEIVLQSGDMWGGLTGSMTSGATYFKDGTQQRREGRVMDKAQCWRQGLGVPEV